MVRKIFAKKFIGIVWRGSQRIVVSYATKTDVWNRVVFTREAGAEFLRAVKEKPFFDKNVVEVTLAETLENKVDKTV
ncbi:hypothetical protein F4808DRAFT_463026 [Astrocystis sublimbata]|nr:hypothetical protein F4808DRAFT_463026 [Astrocystis sublimbata]